MTLRNCCFTWNNPPADAIDKIRALPYVSYGVVGNEVGEAGNPHIQGYLEFRGQKEFAVVHRDLGNAHIEEARIYGAPRMVLKNRDSRVKSYRHSGDPVSMLDYSSRTIPYVGNPHSYGGF